MDRYSQGDYSPEEPLGSRILKALKIGKKKEPDFKRMMAEESANSAEAQKIMGIEALAGNLAKRLGEARARKGLKVEELANRLGIGKEAIEDFENAESIPDVVTLGFIAQELDCDSGWLIGGEGPKVWTPRLKEEGETGSALPGMEYILLPHLKVDPEGEEAFTYEEGVELRVAFKKDELKPTGKVGKVFLFRIKGDSMEPTLQSGDIVIVDGNLNNLDPAGGIYMISMNQSIMVKRVQMLPETGKAEIISDNPRYKTIEAEIEEVKVYGKIIWYGRMFER